MPSLQAIREVTDQKAEQLVKDDRTHYLQDKRDGIVMPQIELVGNSANVRITSWNEKPTGTSIYIHQGGFTFCAELRVEEARLIAQALLLAADDAEKAIDAAYDQDEVAA